MSMLTLDDYFSGREQSRQLFDAVHRAVAVFGLVELRVSKSQVAFRRRKAFAWVWIPGKYLGGETAPLVLTLSLPNRSPSSRWKQIVEPYPGRFTHHLELYTAEQVDDEVYQWLRQAWEDAI